jgi:hypothetical protein
MIQDVIGLVFLPSITWIAPWVTYRTQDRASELLVVTGDQTHYLRKEPSVPDCPHHLWAHSNAAGCAANPGPIEKRSVNPRAFFKSGEQHHCAHREVTVAKASQITASNRDRCGRRSGQEGQAFCEIWRFEEHLCCRTCAFEEVCTEAQVFVLPCQRPTNKGGSLACVRPPGVLSSA